MANDDSPLTVNNIISSDIRRYNLRKSQGLCTNCGLRIESDRIGRVRCKICAAKNSKCRQDNRTTHNLRVRRKREAVQYLGGKCAMCGLVTEIMDIYDFHHKNPEEKEHDVKKLLYSNTWENTIKELNKCEVLCANCHRIKHIWDSDCKRKGNSKNGTR